MKKPMPERLAKRAIELDILRGVAVLLMILDHFMFDLWGMLPSMFGDYPSALSDFARSYWNWEVRTVVRAVVLFVFFGLTGVCCSFTRSNLKRGAKLLVVAMLLTVGTYIASRVTGDRDLTIVFGVLHCLAVCLLLVGLAEKLHTNQWVYLGLGLLLWGIGICISVTVDPHLTPYGAEPFLPLLGKSVLGLAVCGSDCFALPSTLGQVFVGVFFGKRFYASRCSAFGLSYRDNALTFLGRHSLWVYFAHQLLLPVLTALVLVCLGYSFSL